jgi:hypothetical protein
MKSQITLLILVVSLSFVSCKKNDGFKDYPYEAEVLSKNSDCGFYAIKITNGLDQVQRIVGKSVSEGIYIAKNLPDTLQSSGIIIILDIRKPNASELGACTFLGPTYNWLYVIKAKRK